MDDQNTDELVVEKENNNDLIIEETNKNIDNVIEDNTGINNIQPNINNDIVNNDLNKSTRNLTSVVYLIIFISICIWLYFYVTQNKDLMDKIMWGTQTWETLITTWANVTNDEIIPENVNLNNTWETIITDKEETPKTEKDPINTWWDKQSPTTDKKDEAVIQDFEKELDSLFNMIDENAK